VPADQEASIVLVLRPTQWVTGHLRSPDGKPLAGATLHLYSIRIGRYDEIEREHLEAMGLDRGGFGGTWSRKDDSAEAMFLTSCVTAADGSFRMDVRNPGRVLVVAYAPGHGRVTSELGTFDGHRELELEATPRPASDTLFVELDGKRVPDAEFLVADMGYADEQPAFSVTSDAEGRIRTTWLASGRRYALIPTGRGTPAAHLGRPHFFVHGDGAVLDLAKMPTKVE